MTTENCRHCGDETLDYCVRCELKEEMKKCRGCKIAKNRLKRANEIFPDAIVDLICSFNACKRCSKTYDLLKTEPEDLTVRETNIWYFVKLNHFPINKVIERFFPEDTNIFWHLRYWFKELWKSKTSLGYRPEKMIDILRFMFNINSSGYKKLEYPNIFDVEFFRTEIFLFITKQ